VTYVAVAGSVSSVGLIAFLEVGEGFAPKRGFVDELGATLFFLTVAGFLGALLLLLSIFSRWGALVVLIVEGALLGVYFIGRKLFERSTSHLGPPS
jgi:hypothetical protein